MIDLMVSGHRPASCAWRLPTRPLLNNLSECFVKPSHTRSGPKISKQACSSRSRPVLGFVPQLAVSPLRGARGPSLLRLFVRDGFLPAGRGTDTFIKCLRGVTVAMSPQSHLFLFCSFLCLFFFFSLQYPGHDMTLGCLLTPHLSSVYSSPLEGKK